MNRPTGPRGPQGIRPGLERIRAAFGMTGHPERSFRAVHIAGTNGKGSTACFADAILRRALAETVGLYTSPHLLTPEERIRVGGEKIAPAAFARSAGRAATLSREVAAATGEPLSYFEAMTWMAFDWFRRRGASLAVVETGLGGRWDATNVCVPEVSVITTVARDHVEWLGRTLSDIAFEKAGIVRDGKPVVAGDLGAAARRVVEAAARRGRSSIWETGRDLRWEEDGRGRLSFHVPGVSARGVRLRAPGRFQRHNALLAFAAAWVVARDRGSTGRGFERAARGALSEAVWPGRFTRLPGRRNAGAWVDGAHNPSAARVLAEELARMNGGGKAQRTVAVWSMLADKDIRGFVRTIAPVLDGVVAYPLGDERGAALPSLSAALAGAGVAGRKAETFPEAWETARRWVGKRGVTIVCGSLMAAADAYRFRVGSVP